MTFEIILDLYSELSPYFIVLYDQPSAHVFLDDVFRHKEANSCPLSSGIKAVIITVIAIALIYSYQIEIHHQQ